MIRVGLSWGRTLEPRELGLRGFRTLPPPSTGQDLIGHGPWHPTPARASPVDQTSG